MSHRSIGLDRRRILFQSTVAACVISALVLIWSHRFLPITDYPDWIFQGSIVSNLLQAKTSASYAFKHYPVPNSAVVTLIGLLDIILSPEVSGKVALSLCIILFALSSTYLLKSLQHDADSPLLLIPFLFLTNTYFFWGELAYVFGLSFFFFYCGYLFRRTYHSQPINWWFVSVLSIALFFCHFMSYATAILVTLTFILSESRLDLIRPFAISFAPSAGLSIWYVCERSSLKLNRDIWKFWTLHQFAGRTLAAFSPFPEFLPWLGIHAPAMKAFALLDLFAAIFLTLVVPLCAMLWALGRARNRGALACAIICAVTVIFSGYAFADVISPGERLLYPAVWIGLCWLIGEGLPDERSIISRGLTIAVIGLLACQIVFLQIGVGVASNDLAALYSKLRSANSRTEFCATYEAYVRESYDSPHRTGLDVLLTNHASVPRLPYYLFMEQRVAAPIFQTGVLTYTGSGNDKQFCGSL